VVVDVSIVVMSVSLAAGQVRQVCRGFCWWHWGAG